MRILFICSSRYKVSKMALDYVDFNLEYILPSNNLIRFLHLLNTSAREYDIIMIDGHRIGLTVGGFYSTFRNMPLVVRLRGNVWSESEDPFMPCSSKVINNVTTKIGDMFLKSSNLILPVSDYLKKIILKNVMVNPNKICVIYPAIDTNYFSLSQNSNDLINKSRCSHKDEVIILSITNFNYYLKIRPLIDYLSPLQKITKSNKNMKILILGTGKYLSQIKNIYKKRKVENVFFLGYKKDIKYYFSCSDIFLHLSYLDTFGKVIIEAESMKLPVVVNDSCGLKETLVNNKTGYLIHNETELMDKIMTLADNSDLRHRLGEEGRRFAANNFSPWIVGKEFFKVLDKIWNI